MNDNRWSVRKTYEKECVTFEETEEAYAVIFEQVKTLILEVLKLLLEIDNEQDPVIQQIIEVVKDIEFNNGDGRFC